MTSFPNGSNLKISSAQSIVSPNPHDERQDFVAEIKFNKKYIFFLNIQTFLYTDANNIFGMVLATG